MRRASPQMNAVLDALRSGATYGLEVARQTGLKTGTIYPILHRLERAGWVRSTCDCSSAVPGRPARRIYALTTAAPARTITA